jgi:hypothetical protein
MSRAHVSLRVVWACALLEINWFRVALVLTPLLAVGWLFLMPFVTSEDPSILPCELTSVFAEHEEMIHAVAVYDLGSVRCGFPDSRFLCRIEADSEFLPLLVAGLGVKEIPETRVPSLFWHQASRWWKPKRTEAVRFFRTPGYSKERFLLMSQPEESAIYLIGACRW